YVRPTRLFQFLTNDSSKSRPIGISAGHHLLQQDRASRNVATGGADLPARSRPSDAPDHADERKARQSERTWPGNGRWLKGEVSHEVAPRIPNQCLCAGNRIDGE